MSKLGIGNPAFIAQTQNPLIVSNGLVGYWSFNERNPSKAVDYSTSRNDGVYTGGATFVAGRKGSGISLNGSSQYVSLNSTNLSGLPASNNWSVSCWINQTVLNLFSGIIIFNNDGLVNTKSNKLGAIHAGSVGACSVDFSSFVGQWTHVVATATPPAYNFYINGVLANSNLTIDSGYGLSGLYELGNGFNNTKITALLDEVRIYNRTLTSGEVSALYIA